MNFSLLNDQIVLFNSFENSNRTKMYMLLPIFVGSLWIEEFLFFGLKDDLVFDFQFVEPRKINAAQEKCQFIKPTNLILILGYAQITVHRIEIQWKSLLSSIR